MSEKKNKDLISIIMPTYNGHDFLADCLDSVLGQTYENLEIIVVDDASTDDSLQIARSYADRDDRVHVIERKKNGGQSAARNTGVGEATGDGIAFIDNDDTYEPEFLEVVHDNALAHDVKISGCANYRIEPERKFIADINGKPTGKYSAEELVIKILYKPAYTWTEIWNKIYHKSLKGQLYFPEGAQLEDFLVVIPLLYNEGEAFFDNRPLYNWIIRETSQSEQLFFENKMTFWQSAEWLRNGFIDKGADKQYINAVYTFEYGAKAKLLEDMVRTGERDNIRRAKEMLPGVAALRKHVRINGEFTQKSALHCKLRLAHVKFARG